MAYSIGEGREDLFTECSFYKGTGYRRSRRQRSEKLDLFHPDWPQGQRAEMIRMENGSAGDNGKFGYLMLIQ